MNKAVRRLGCERLDVALNTLENAGRSELVHDVRKEIKKLRAVLRLVRSDIGDETYAEYTKTLRGAAGRLTALRDAEVRVGAFDSLAKNLHGKRGKHRPFPEIKSALRDLCRAEESKLFKGDALASVRDTLSSSKEQFENLKVNSRGWKAIYPGLKKIYRRNRKMFDAADQEPSPKNFHEWRKRVKDLSNQLRLFRRARPRKLRGRMDDLDKLGDLLGDDHDLFMLNEFVSRKFNHAPDVRMFEDLIAARQKELRAEALKLGGQFYEKPSRFCRKIEDYWKDWRRGG